MADASITSSSSPALWLVNELKEIHEIYPFSGQLCLFIACNEHTVFLFMNVVFLMSLSSNSMPYKL